MNRFRHVKFIKLDLSVTGVKDGWLRIASKGRLGIDCFKLFSHLRLGIACQVAAFCPFSDQSVQNCVSFRPGSSNYYYYYYYYY